MLILLDYNLVALIGETGLPPGRPRCGTTFLLPLVDLTRQDHWPLRLHNHVLSVVLLVATHDSAVSALVYYIVILLVLVKDLWILGLSQFTIDLAIFADVVPGGDLLLLHLDLLWFHSSLN